MHANTLLVFVVLALPAMALADPAKPGGEWDFATRIIRDQGSKPPAVIQLSADEAWKELKARIGVLHEKGLTIIKANSWKSPESEGISVRLRSQAAFQATHGIRISAQANKWEDDYSPIPAWTSKETGDGIRFRLKKDQAEQISFLRISCRDDQTEIYVQLVNFPRPLEVSRDKDEPQPSKQPESKSEDSKQPQPESMERSR